MSELVWIAVPGGIGGDGRPLLRVLVVPRLDAGTLEASGLAVWPPAGLLETDSLSVEWRPDEDADVTETRAARADVTFHAQPGVWERFFAPDTRVGAGDATAVHPQPEVRPTHKLAADIEATYAEPSRADFAVDARPDGYDDLVRGELARWQDADPSSSASPGSSAPPTPPPPPDFDLTISLLREHPAVLRALGLVFELHVTPPPALAPAGQVRVRWPGASASAKLPRIVSPWTRYGRAFFPFSPSGEISAGMVPLRPDALAPAPEGDERWQVVTVDVEGAASRLRDAAGLAAAPRTAGDAGPAVSLPAMRTAGVQLVRVDRHEAFARRRRAGSARGALDEHVLDADDLVLGYRIDIKRGGGAWRSLHERIATYRVDGSPIGEQDTVEEGHVKVHGAARESDGVLRADEVVARWSGWSLAVARPRFDAAPGAPGPSRLAGLPFALDWTFLVPPGSLPLLRFGASYSLRARVVDMAGGGLAPDDPAADRGAITAISYGRYEPVPSPAVLLEAGVAPEDLAPGEAADRIVVRSGPAVDVGSFAAANPGHPLHARRSLHRPDTSLEIAEQHKMLDHDPATTFPWVQRALAANEGATADGGPLPDPAAGGVQVVPRREPGAPAATITPRDWARPWPEPEPPKVLELRDRAEGELAVTWAGETLVVRLKPAEQLTLELSSTLTEDFFDHFALSRPESEPVAKAGRNPLITPARAVTLVHAVRRPLSAPDPDTALTPEPREPGQTFAVLDPHPVFLGLDADSTAQLDVTAAWIERDDDARRQVTGAPVQSIVVHRGDTALRDPLRHELPDTRRRDVTYTLTAVGRFRQFFDCHESPDAFVESTVLRVGVTIPSSSRPAPPIVLAARPAFAWEETTETGAGSATVRRTRGGGRVRLELARPWYETGDGERLAVVLWDPSAGGTPPAHVLVTEVGRDPIRYTSGPERWPAAASFAGTAGDGATPAPVAETGERVQAVPYEPWFHEDRWHADIALPGVAASSYCPLVQLAVARYQPGSIAGYELSPVVRTEAVALLPDRTLSVQRFGDLLYVSLAGLGPEDPFSSTRVDVVLEHCTVPPGVEAGAIDLTAFAPPAGGLPAWEPVPEGTQHIGLGSAAQLRLPPDLGPLRVRVREIEIIGAETVVPSPLTGTPDELSERVVFTDVVAVPALP